MSAATAAPTSVPFVGLVPEFYIPATSSLAERRPRTLKHGDTFAVFDHYGDVTPAERSPEGLFHEDTRYLSALELCLDARRPLLLSSTIQDDNATLTADLTNPDIYEAGRVVLPCETIHLVRSKFIWRSACYERVGIRNFDQRAHVATLSYSYGADFADLFEVRGHVRPRTGTRSVEIAAPGTVVLRYLGLDGIERVTRICFEPAPDRLQEARAEYLLRLAPGARTAIFVTVQCLSGREVQRKSFFAALRSARRELRNATRRIATVEASNAVFNEVVCRATADLYMLMTDTPEGPYPYAGIPWFSTAFGRDGIITALQLLWLDPRVARGTLRHLAALQADRSDAQADAEPGKILHETRRGEMARLGEVPFRLYYGSVDATPLFVLLAGMYFERTGDLETLREIWPNVQAALRWIDTYGDIDGDGFVEYRRRSADGLDNQGWKDSHDSIFHADGRMATGAIALCEVQAYVYAAKKRAAVIARTLGEAATATALEQQAEVLRARFEEVFWCEDLGTYALALDGEKRPCRVRASNAGHALFGGIASPARAKRTAANLLSAEMFSGWGIRTVGAAQARYNPMSYHNGSIWPHDNALIALGMARYGLKREVCQVFAAQFDAATYMFLRRLPELFCGLRRRPHRGPTFYPVACSPQAWASAAPLAMLQAALGIECSHAANAIRLDRPLLPEFLEMVRIRRIQVADTTLDLTIRRHEGDAAVIVSERVGSAEVLTTS